MKNLITLLFIAFVLGACNNAHYKQTITYIDYEVSNEYTLVIPEGFQRVSLNPIDSLPEDIEIWQDSVNFLSVDRRTKFDTTDLAENFERRKAYYRNTYIERQLVIDEDSIKGMRIGKYGEIGAFACIKKVGNRLVLMNYEGRGVTFEKAQVIFNSLRPLANMCNFDTTIYSQCKKYECEAYSFDYPYDWKIVRFPQKGDDLYCGSEMRKIGFSLGRFYDVNYTLEEVKDMALQQMWKKYLKAESEKTTIKGLPAYKIKMDGFDGNCWKKEYVYMFFVDDVLYNIRFGYNPKTVDNYLATYDNILNSFQFK